MTVEALLRRTAEESGLVGIGFCRADPFPEVEVNLRDAVQSGRSAGLGFTFRDPATSTDLRASFPWAESIVAVAHAYLPAAGDPGQSTPGTGRIARFATKDHYQRLRSGLNRLAGVLRESGFEAEVLCDDSRFVDRAAAVRAGIAWWGKSSMVLAPGVGPWILLGSVVTDAALSSDGPMRRSCGTCDSCLPACPTGALLAPGILDSRRCLAAAAQSPGPIPIELREAMGDRLYGCDECLTACPPGERLRAASNTSVGRVDLEEILALDDHALRSRFPQFYVPRNDGRYLKRNAIVALGNSGTSRNSATLLGFLETSDPLLRSHAAWALGRIGGSSARDALASARRSEGNETVLREIDLALGTLG